MMRGLILGGIVLGMSSATGRAAVALVKEGKPLAKIYIQSKAADDGHSLDSALTPREMADDFNSHLKEMSGAQLEVVTTDDASAVKGPAVVLGDLAVKLGAMPQKKSESGEGFRLLTRDNLVLIGGQTDRGAQQGMYELLRKLGCDWVMPGQIGRIIPHKPDVTVEDVDEAQAPAFVFRTLTYHGRRPKQGNQRLAAWERRMQGGTWDYFAMRTGGHAWGGLIHRNQKVFDAHPEMLALVRQADGSLKRQGPQLESTDPRVVDLFVAEIEKAYEKNIQAGKWTAQTPAGFGIGPSDGGGESISPQSLAAGSGRIDPITGGLDYTDQVVLLGNQVLQRVKAKYPNVYVGYYVYASYADYPARYQPDPHLALTFAPITYSRYHSVIDPHSKTQAFYRTIVEKWSELSRKQGNPLIFRGYNWNLAENMVPFTKVQVWGEELPWYKKMGFKALRVEADDSFAELGPSDYVFMRLAWDTSLDWRKLVHEYCQHAYGKGAGPMEQYFLAQADRQSKAGQEAGSYYAIPLIYDQAWVDHSRSLMDQALAAADTKEDKTRIGYIKEGLQSLQLYLDYHKAAMAFDFPAVKKEYEAILSHQKAMNDLNPDLASTSIVAYLKRFLSPFVEQSGKYSSGDYKIVQPLPDAMKTILDPHDVGAQMNYFGAEINDKDWINSRTYSTTWDDQGWGNYAGGVWYRWRFTLPADFSPDKPVGLFLGGFSDQARVWVNGKEMGRSPRGFSKPYAVDLTDGLKAGTENLLTIQIVAHAKNELGMGGLIRPSFLFTGPRVAAPAPAKGEPARVLPGAGEVKE
jgi:hypothetical protein